MQASANYGSSEPLLQLRELQIRVPGSIANLGPGFDTLAVAVELYLTLSVHRMEGSGEVRFDFGGAAPDGVNCIARAFHFLAQDRAAGLPSIAVEVRSEIPMKAGLGSSAAATVAGLRLFEAVSGRRLSQGELLTAASALEGHPDNVAAALLGGLAISCEREDGTVSAVSTVWPQAVRFLVLTPQHPLSTSAARSVLPDEISRRDAVCNLQRVALLMWALQTHNYAYLKEALRDRLHQPYRQAIVPGLQELLALEHPELLGVCLSGAGPSVVALVQGNPTGVETLLASTYRKTGAPFTVRLLTAHAEHSCS